MHVYMRLLVGERHVLHTCEESRIIAVLRNTRLAVVRAWCGSMAVVGPTSRCVRVNSWVATVVGRWGDIGRTGWIVSTVVHRTTTSSDVWITTGICTITAVYLLWVLLALCPGRHAVSSLGSIGRELMRKSIMAIIEIGLRSVVAAST